MTDIIKDALEIHRTGGDDAVMTWYNGLPPERQKEFVDQIKTIVTQMQFVWNELRPSLEIFVRAMVDYVTEWNRMFTVAMQNRN